MSRCWRDATRPFAVELDFELEAIGFDMPEIDLRIESLQAETGQGLTQLIPLPHPAAGPAVTRPGEPVAAGAPPPGLRRRT
jgi:hypothetical protein